MLKNNSLLHHHFPAPDPSIGTNYFVKILNNRIKMLKNPVMIFNFAVDPKPDFIIKYLHNMAKKVADKKVNDDKAFDLFEEELDVALMYLFQIFEKNQALFDSYITYSGEFEKGPSYEIAIHPGKNKIPVKADISLELKNLSKFIKELEKK